MSVTALTGPGLGLLVKNAFTESTQATLWPNVYEVFINGFIKEDNCRFSSVCYCNNQVPPVFSSSVSQDPDSS